MQMIMPVAGALGGGMIGEALGGPAGAALGTQMGSSLGYNTLGAFGVTQG